MSETAQDRAEGFHRPASQVMRLARMGSMHQCRLSFMRSLLRDLRRGNWRFDRPVWEIDGAGVGRAVYRATGPEENGAVRTYSLVAFAHDLPDDLRSDRVIATAWDATFALVDGEPDADDLDRLQANVPLQEAGRVSDKELSLSRANRSVRLWSHVLERLSAGEQPDPEQIAAVGYLMRTTAVYGSGKFGAADRAKLSARKLMARPFHAEMLSVWLTRAFTLDLVEHMAQAKGGAQATVIAPALRRQIGVGNSTGLGMAPFLITHPALIHAWFAAREEAIARVRALPAASPAEQAVFADRLARARLNAAAWRSEHPAQIRKLAALRADLDALAAHLAAGALNGSHPWDALIRWSESALSLEGQEQCLALMLEPYGPLVDDLVDAMAADELSAFRIDGAMPVARLREILSARYGWALAAEYDAPEACARFWYVSEEKLEPRLGERFEEPGAELELPLDVGRAAKALSLALADWDGAALVADFLLRHPEHRHTVRRAQLAAGRAYAEIQDNLLGAEVLPIDLLRAKLSFFGATRFDPRSDRWVRIAMYQGAPFPHELGAAPEDDWAYPQRETSDG